MDQRALIVMSGVVDIPKHQQLLKLSMDKYKDYVLHDRQFSTLS